MLTAIAIAVVSILPADVERYAAAQRNYAKAQTDLAHETLKQARIDLARARRSGEDSRGPKLTMAKATTRIKELSRFRGVPVLSKFKAGEIGKLTDSPGYFYRVVDVDGEAIEVAPEFDGIGSNNNGATFQSVVTANGRNLIVQPSDIGRIGDDVDYYKPIDVFEVMGHQSGKPVLRVFDAKGAQAELDKRSAR